jgi:hypothetical protein
VVPASWRREHWRVTGLALLVLPPLLLRLWLIHHFPEPDTDAAGHLGIARAVIADPGNVAVHWVYLPAYHLVLAAFLLLGLGADAIRIVNCTLASLVPLFVLGYGASARARDERDPERHAPWMAAALCAVSPLVNLLGTSAQQETLFTLLVLGAVWAFDVRRFALAGAILGIASLVRYEAWGAVALLVALRAIGALRLLAGRLPERVARVCALPFAVVAPSLVAIGGWLLAHKLREGEWLGFLRELYRYTHEQRAALHRDITWFPIEQPLFVFGSVVAILFFVGLRRAWRPSHVIPLGVYVFLLGAYLFNGALGSARYYESLTPFVALAAAYGACTLGARWRWLAPALIVASTLQLAGLSTQLFLWTWPPSVAAETRPVAPRHADAHGVGS